MKQYLLTEDDLNEIRFALIQLRLEPNDIKKGFISKEIDVIITSKEITDVDA